MQGTVDQNMCAGNKFVKLQLTKHACSRNRCGTFWFSWNICKLIVVGFCHIIKSTFCTVSCGFKLGSVFVYFQGNLRRTHNSQRARAKVRAFCRNDTQWCSRVTPTYHRATFNKTLFESKRVQARLLDFQTKARGRRTSQGIADTTTVHHQSSRNLSCFWNFVQTQSYADSFVIAVCLLLLEFLL